MFIDVLGALDRARAAGQKVDLSSMRDGITAGAPNPPQLMRRMIQDLHMKHAAVKIIFSIHIIKHFLTEINVSKALLRRTHMAPQSSVLYATCLFRVTLLMSA